MAIDDTAAQISQALLGLSNSLARAEPRLQAVFDKIIAANEELAVSYADKLKADKAYTKKDVDAAMLRIAQLKKVAEQENALHTQYNTAFKKFQEQAKTLKGDELKQAANNYTATYNTYKEGLKKIQTAATEREALEQKVASRWSDTMRDTWKAQKDKLLSSDALVKSVTEGYSALTESAATQMGIDLTTAFTDTALLGFKPTEFIKFQADFRRTELAMVGGQKSFISGLKAGEDAYKNMIIDPTERSKAIAQQFQILSDSGIRPAAADASMFANTLTRVSQLTGKKANEINADLASIADDESTQTLLKMAATEDERRSIIQATQAQYANSIALGMSSKQAIASATALNKLQTQTQKSRISEAARIRALGGALGMGAQGAELAAIRAKAPSALTAQDKARAVQLSAALSEKVTQMRGMGGAAALTIESLTEGLKLDQQFGPDSPFNTTLARAVAPLGTDMHLASDKLTGLATTVEKYYSWITKNPLLVGGLSATNLLLTAILGEIGAVGVGGAAAGAAGGLAEAAAGAAGLAAGGAALLATAAVSALVGYGIEKIMPTSWQNAIGSGVNKALNVVGMGEDLDDTELKRQIDAASAASHEKIVNQSKIGAAIAVKQSPADVAKTEGTISDHLKKIDTSNDLLKSISENSATSAEFAEKLLAVMTLTDKDRTDAARRSVLMGDNRFVSKNFGNAM